MTNTLTLAQVAALRGVSVDTVRRAVRRGELPSVRLGRTLRVPADAVTDATPDDVQQIIADAFAEIGEKIERLEKAVTTFGMVAK